MARSVRNKVRTAGGFVFGDYWGMRLLGGGGFDWAGFVVCALAGGVIGLPVMVFF
ncbi:MAG: hypothetical protein H5T82_02280 [Demequina sp.]|nr:hypothetical protein [Demequina sp.]